MVCLFHKLTVPYVKINNNDDVWKILDIFMGTVHRPYLDLYFNREYRHANYAAQNKITSGQTIIFTETLYNYGDGYNNNTGVFTAPFAGTYLFTGQLCSTINKYIPSGIEVDGKDVSRTLGYGKEYISWTNFDAIVMVERSSSVLIKSYYSRDQLTGSYIIRNTFTGVLLHI